MKVFLHSMMMVLMALVPSLAMAQGNTVAEATPLQMGDNVTPFLEGEDYYVHRYYSYKAEESGYLDVTGTSSIMVYSALASDGREASCLHKSPGCIVPMREGDEVYLDVSPNMILETDTMAFFNVRFTVNDNACRGKVSSDPILIEDGSMSITTDTEEGFTEFYSYMVFDAKDTGALKLTCSAYVLSGRFGVDFDNLTGGFTASYESGEYTAMVPVEEGQRVCIRLSAYEAMSVRAKMVYPERGTSSNYPIILKEGENEVSAEFGEYWYKYEGAKQDGYVEIVSEYEIPRGYVQIFTSDLSYQVAYSQTGTYNVRFKVSANTSYLIYIYKPEESEEWPDPDLFNLTFEPLKQGESSSNPIRLDLNVAFQMDNATGTYYYALTIPSDLDNQMLEVKASGAGAQGCYMLIYDMRDGRYYNVSGYGSVNRVVEAGHAYMIEVTKQAYGSAEIMPSSREIYEGEHITKPIEARLGANAVASAKEIYYSYTATMNGRISLSFDIPGVSVDFPISTDASQGVYNHVVSGLLTKLDVVKGKTYLIRIANVSEPCTMTISEAEYQQGEIREMALEMGIDGVQIQAGRMDVWYKYVAPRSGKMTVTTSFIGDNNTFLYCCTDKDPNPQIINNTNDDGDIIYYHVLPMDEGDVLYVHYVSSSERAGERIICTLKDFSKGETKDDPLILNLGENILVPHASRNQMQWIRIPVDGCEKVTIVTDRFISGGVYVGEVSDRDFDLFFTPDANNDIFTALYESDSPATDLYVCVTLSYGSVNLFAYGEEGGSTSIGSLHASDGSKEYFSLDGRRLSRMQSGINIVRSEDGKVRKVMK